MKPAVFRPQAKQDFRDEVRYDRKKAGTRVARRLVTAIGENLRSLEQQPAMGSPKLGQEVEIEELRTWEVSGFPLLLIYIERLDHLDVVRVLGQRQNVAALIRKISGK